MSNQQQNSGKSGGRGKGRSRQARSHTGNQNPREGEEEQQHTRPVSAPQPGARSNIPQGQEPPRSPAVSSSSSTHSLAQVTAALSLESGSSGNNTPRQSSFSSASSRPQSSSSESNVHKIYSPSVAANLQIPKRRDPSKAGTLGRRIQVDTNLFQLDLNNLPQFVLHYDIKFEPDKPKCLLRKAYEAFRVKKFNKRHPAFDGRSNVYASSHLPFDESITDTVEIEDADNCKTRTFCITMQHVATLDMSWLKQIRAGLDERMRNNATVQALEVILRHGAASRSAAIAGNSLFTQHTGVVMLPSGLEVWIGSYQSAVIGWKPFLNVDVVHKGFPTSQNVIDLMAKFVYGDNARPPVDPLDLGQRHKESISKFLKRLKVSYKIPNMNSSKRTWIVNELYPATAREYFIEDAKMTVFDYFKSEKHYDIKNPDLPLVWVGPKERKILLPAELCTIMPGQVINRKLDEKQTTGMIRVASTNTDKRKEKIREGFKAMRYNEDPCITQEFGVQVNGTLTRVGARVLNPPQLLYQQKPVTVQKGVWRAQAFHQTQSEPVRNWTILNLDQRLQDNVIYDFHSFLIKKARAMGMRLGDAITPFGKVSRDYKQILQHLQELKDNKQCELVIVIFPDFDSDIYGTVKQVAELKVGLLTQCLKSGTVRTKMNDATIGNILLKLNSKLNGINHILDQRSFHDYNRDPKRPSCLQKPCIIIGADVTHPSPDSTDMPSIVGIAASHDPNAFQYNIEIQFQPPRVEEIQNLKGIIMKQLTIFFRKTRSKPERIIYYRDGVSEGQFEKVLRIELSAIRDACRSMPGQPYEPPITFIVVQKRHHIRLFPTNERESDDRNKNVRAGTIVDTEITHPSHIDFYLVSHASIQGTARPTKYRCLWDDYNMTEDQIEELTYFLCHTFSRCTRSVSYPTPTYYAHLAAFRARALIQKVPINLHDLEKSQKDFLTLHKDMEGNPMFFV